VTTYSFVDPPPYTHQIAILNKIIETRGITAILADPGTGKSRTGVDYMGMLATKYGTCRSLVIAPRAALDTWLLQMEAYLPPEIGVHAEVIEGTILQRAERLSALAQDTGGAPRRNLVYKRPDSGNGSITMAVVNTETFATRRIDPKTKTVKITDRLLKAAAAFSPSVEVLDESHRIKGSSSTSSKNIARIGKLSPRRLMMTGTVTPHSPLDVYGQWRFLDPTVFATNGTPWSFGDFSNRYGIWGGYQGEELKGVQNLDDLYDRIAPSTITVSKAEALDLPPTTNVIVPVRLSPADDKAYREMKKSLVTALANGTLMSAPNRAVQILRLRQITAGQSKIQLAVDKAKDLMESENRLVVFTYFRPETAAVHQALTRSLSRHGVRVEMIEGSTPDPERRDIRNRFGGSKADLSKPMILVAQMRTMSLSVNELVTANHALFLSLSERRDDFVQAKDRLDRIGQKRPVTFWHFQVPGSVDEVIYAAHQDRQDAETAMLDYLKAAL
jgi:hypothetical protein